MRLIPKNIMEDSNNYFLKEINNPRDMRIKVILSQKWEKAGDLQQHQKILATK